MVVVALSSTYVLLLFAIKIITVASADLGSRAVEFPVLPAG